MIEKQFRLRLSKAIAEDDFDVCECCKCGASDLTTAGIDHLVEIMMALVQESGLMISTQTRAPIEAATAFIESVSNAFTLFVANNYPLTYAEAVQASDRFRRDLEELSKQNDSPAQKEAE